MSQFWLNVPVADLERSKKFFRAIGLQENMNQANNPTMGCFFLDENKTVMCLFPHAAVEKFLGNAVTDTSTSNEVLFNLGAATREDVDAYIEKVAQGGGVMYAMPSELDGWMYGCGFVDPDGHRWSVLYMDMSKMPK